VSLTAILVADLTGDSTLALAAVTVILAGAAVYGAWLTRRALAAAKQDMDEAIKARIDQQAPRVVILAEQWPPTLFQRSGASKAAEIIPGQSIDRGSQVIGLAGWFRLENEGNSTAIVQLPPNVLPRRHDEKEMPKLDSGVIDDCPPEPTIARLGAGAHGGAVFDRLMPDSTHFHDLRHYYASLLIHAGESVKTVQARLGHASAIETLDTYGHLWPDSEDRTRQAVDDAFSLDISEDNGDSLGTVHTI
jgi:hypothetical protein